MSNFASIQFAAIVLAFGVASTASFAAVTPRDANVNASIQRQMDLDTAPHASLAGPAASVRGPTFGDTYIRSSEMRESAFSTGIIR